MAAPLVSILIPCHNAERWLPAALESAFSQTWPRIEVILVDDGSTDRSLDLARSFEPRGLRVLSQPNSGASAARNRGLRSASGDLVQFLDADDVLAPEKIERQVARLAESPAGSVASSEWGRFRLDPAECVFAAQPVWRDLGGIEFMLLHYNLGWMMPPIAWLAPRSLLDRAGPWREDLSLNDDGEYFCRVLVRSSGIVFCPGSRACYRSGLQGSLSGRKDDAALASLARSVEGATRTLLAAEDSPRVREACANAWQQVCFELYPRLPAEVRRAEREAHALGGARRRIEGGRAVLLADRVLGWRAAARLKARWG
jgi:glycosyltransferase involved in cell wall biosynthesis